MCFFSKFLNFKILFFSLFLLANFVQAKSENLEINTKNVIDLVNLERVKQGKDILQESEKLNQVAQSKLEDMQKNDYFSHNSPTGKKPWDWFAEKDYKFENAGENLALNFFTAEKQNQSWMKSVGHKANILNDKFTETGVAVGEVNFKNKKAILTVQVFATPQKIIVSSPNFTPQTYQVPANFFYGGLKNNEENLDNHLSLENIFTEKPESTFNFVTWTILILMTVLIIVLEWRIFTKKI